MSASRFWSTTLPVAVLVGGGLLLMSIFTVPAVPRWVTGKNDFLPFFAGGRLAFSGHLYDQARILEEEQRSGKAAGENLHFIRPPWFAGALWPAAQLGYLPAYFLWQVLLCFSLAAFVWWWKPPGAVHNLVALCFSLPALTSVLNGQDTPLLLLWMTLAGLLARRNQAFPAGAVLALTQAKFHLFLPLWILLAAGRKWRILGGMAAGNLALAIASCLVAGWRWPLEYYASVTRDVVTPGAEYMPTLHHFFNRSLPFWWVFAAAALVVVAAWIAGRRLDAVTIIAIAPALMIPVVKHTYVFDGVTLLPLVMVAVASGSKLRYLAALAVAMPIVWMGCLGGDPYSLAAPVAILALAITTFVRIE